MFQWTARRILDAQQKAGASFNSEEREMMEYGLSYGLGCITTIALTLLTGFALGRFGESVVFCVAFMSLRTYAGGYHANGEFRCFVITMASIVLALLLSGVYQSGWQLPLTLASWISGGLLILVMAPVAAVNKPLDDIERKVYGQKSRIILGVESAALLLSQILGLHVVSSTLSIVILMIGLTVLAGKVQLKMQSSPS